MQAIISSATDGAIGTPAGYPDRIILVYDGASGARAMVLDAVKKALGREDCARCAITHGALAKREAWRQCEARMGLKFDALHRDQLPEAWRLSRCDLPCVLGRVGDSMPFVLVPRSEIEASVGRAEVVKARILAALAARDIS